MRRRFGRLLFTAFAVGQLQLIPAALACVREHQQPAMASHCADETATGGPTVRAAHDAGGTLCAILGPCAAANPAVTGVQSTMVVLRDDRANVRMPASLRPDSFDTAPPAPPPEA